MVLWLSQCQSLEKYLIYDETPENRLQHITFDKWRYVSKYTDALHWYFIFFLNCCRSRSCRIAWNWLDRDYILSNSRFTQWDFKIKIDTLVLFLHNTVREYLFSDPIYRYINVINARNLVVYCEICQSKFCIEGESCSLFFNR